MLEEIAGLSHSRASGAFLACRHEVTDRFLDQPGTFRVVGQCGAPNPRSDLAVPAQGSKQLTVESLTRLPQRRVVDRFLDQRVAETVERVSGRPGADEQPGFAQPIERIEN